MAEVTAEGLAKISSIPALHCFRTYSKRNGSPNKYRLHTFTFQDFFQCIFTARVAPYHICVAPACLFHRAADHFVGYGVRKKYDQVRASDLFAQACGHLGEYFCLAVEPSADLLILTYHSVMAAYDYNAHIEPPDDNKYNCA